MCKSSYHLLFDIIIAEIIHKFRDIVTKYR